MVNKRYPIIISLVTWNGAHWLPWCLKALARSGRQDFFLMIIDNASIDNSVMLVEQFLAANPALARRTRLVKNRVNLGFARAHNQAITWTDSDFVLILNQDIILSENYLDEAVTCLRRDERTAAVTGKLLKWNFDSATFYLGAEINANPMIDSLGLQVHRSRRVTNVGQGESDHGQYDEPRRVFGASATVALFRREALMAVSPGGEVFDEDFNTYKEDVDLAWRLAAAGYDTWYLPQAIAYHDRSLSGAAGVLAEAKQRRARSQDVRVYSYTNHLAILIKNEAGYNFARDWLWIIAHEKAKALFLLFTDPATLWRGWGRFLHLLPRFMRKRKALKSTRRRAPAELRSWWVTRTVKSKV